MGQTCAMFSVRPVCCPRKIDENGGTTTEYSLVFHFRVIIWMRLRSEGAQNLSQVLTGPGPDQPGSEPGAPVSSTALWTRERAYGHEQRHIVNLLKNTRDVMGPWLDQKELAIEWFDKQSVCQATDFSKVVEEAKEHWQKKVVAPEEGHENKPPAYGVGYDPINGKIPQQAGQWWQPQPDE